MAALHACRRSYRVWYIWNQVRDNIPRSALRRLQNTLCSLNNRRSYALNYNFQKSSCHFPFYFPLYNTTTADLQFAKPVTVCIKCYIFGSKDGQKTKIGIAEDAHCTLLTKLHPFDRYNYSYDKNPI